MTTYHVSHFTPFDIDITYPDETNVLIEGKSLDFIRYEIERTIKAGNLQKIYFLFYSP